MPSILGYYDESGDPVNLPARWTICSICRGDGTSSFYLGAFSREDFEDLFDVEEREAYVRGNSGGRTYNGRGKLMRTNKNPHRISLATLIQREGFTDVMEALTEWTYDSACPALCDEGCEVEPDGRCEHGCPSALIGAGII